MHYFAKFIPDGIPVCEIFDKIPYLVPILSKKQKHRKVCLLGDMEKYRIFVKRNRKLSPVRKRDILNTVSNIPAVDEPPEGYLIFSYNYDTIPKYRGGKCVYVTEVYRETPPGFFTIPYKNLYVHMNFPIPNDRIRPFEIREENVVAAFDTFEDAVKALKDVRGGVYAKGDIFGRLRELNRKDSTIWHTLPHIAEKMVTEMYKPGMRVLEPACGTGIFVLKILERDPEADIAVCDIDPYAVEAVKINARLNGYTKAKITGITGDFLYTRIDGRFDLVIGNPPWISIRLLKGKYADAVRLLGYEIKPQNIPNLDIAGLFVKKAYMLLDKGGKIAFVMPKSVKQSIIFDHIRDILDCKFISFDSHYKTPAVIMYAERSDAVSGEKNVRKPYYYTLGRIGADVAREPFTVPKEGIEPRKAAVHVNKNYEVEYVDVYLPISVKNGVYSFEPGYDPELIATADFFGKLTTPAQRERYKVVYNQNGNRVRAAIIDDPEIIITDRLVYIPCRNMDEARYLRDILNSDELNEFVDRKRSSTRGHIAKRALLFPIPRYSKVKIDDFLEEKNE